MERKKGKILEKYKQLPVTAKATFWIFACSIIQKAIQMLTVPIVTRMLNTNEYGVYSVFVSWSNIFIIIGTLRLHANGYYVGMKRYGNDNQRYLSSIAGLTFVLVSITGIAVFVFKGSISAFTGLTYLELALMIVWIYGQGAIELCFANSRYSYTYQLIVILTLFISILTPILKILLIRMARNRNFDAALAAITAFVIPVVLSGLIVWLTIMWKGRFWYVPEYWKFALTFNIPLIPFYLSQTLLHQSDRIMIERLDSASSAGIYSVAYSLATTVSIIIQAVNSSLSPWQFQNMKKGNVEKVSNGIDSVFVGIIGIFACFTLVVPEIMKLFADEKYYESIYVVPPVVTGMLMTWVTQVFLNVEYYYEKNVIMSVSSIISAFLNIVLNYMLIPHIGYIAAAYTTLVCFGANMVLHGIVASNLCTQKCIQKPYHISKIVIGLFISVFLMLLSEMLYNKIVIRYFVFLFVFIITVLFCGKDLYYVFKKQREF